jgi:hypothetical protein
MDQETSATVNTIARPAALAAAGPVIVLTPMPVWQQVGVRVVRVYLQTFLGLWSVNGLGVIDLSKVTIFGEQWNAIAMLMLLAIAPAFVTLCQNALEFLTEMDQRRPTLRA